MLKSVKTFPQQYNISAEDVIPSEVTFIIHFCLSNMLPNDQVAVSVVEADMADDEVAMVSPITYGDSHIYYEIEINPAHYGADDFLAYICHECVHIKQFIEGSLSTEEDLFFWCDEHYPIECAADYWFAPWEIEARGLQGALYEAYLNRHDQEWRVWLRKVRAALKNK